MSETLKKKTAPRKTAAKKKTAPAEPSNVPPTHQDVELLAYQLWADRGHHHGDDAQDWLHAEEQLRTQQ
ncbi:hypothetical protein HDF16_006307 [Granulicella aggregans]|uniref:DUF2934 domain-containing protein n=1 Tax=Granulicella aggregans TaxID=474949 RepID=A0A7W7ZLV1_9BACT|nr:DUF2934 domain-containing protein [Granulicella aggregans]MBB5061571.1 hypothetical protein [Granulicella aggregans]